MAETPLKGLPENEPIPPVTQLIDIEPPVKPGIDWIGWIEWGLIFFLVVLLLFVFLRVMRFLWPGWRVSFLLAAVAKRLQNADLKERQALSMNLYEVFQTARQKQLLTDEDSLQLSAQINSICFSKQEVSHETLLAFIRDFRNALTLRHSAEKYNILKQWLPKKTGKRHVDG